MPVNIKSDVIKREKLQLRNVCQYKSSKNESTKYISSIVIKYYRSYTKPYVYF